TRAEAERVVFLHRAAPDLPPLNGWSLAQVYALREARADSVADLDHLLAFAPWRHGKPGWDRYDHAIAAGWIVEAPLYLTKPLRTGIAPDPTTPEELDLIDQFEHELYMGVQRDSREWRVKEAEARDIPLR